MAGGFDQLFAKAGLGQALAGALAVVAALFLAGRGTGWLIWG